MSDFLPRFGRSLQRLPRAERLFLLLALVVAALRVTAWLAGSTVPFQGLATTLTVLLGVILGVKYLLRFIRRTVWRLRNRLILAYVFIGVVPIALILAMLGIGMYVLMGQVATYLMTAEIRRRNEIVRDCAYALAWNVAAHRDGSQGAVRAQDFLKQLQGRLPKLQAVVRRDGQLFSLPADGGVSEFPGWSKPGFLGLINSAREYALAAHIRIEQAGHEIEIFTYEAADPALLASLLPRLASISFMELQDVAADHFLEVETGREVQRRYRNPQDPSGKRVPRFHPSGKSEVVSRDTFTLPPPQAWWDVEVRWGTPVPVRRWEAGGSDRLQVLVRVVSRPSLIIRQLFSTLGPLAGSVLLLFYIIGGLFLLVEIASLVFGVGLTRSITRSVADLYEGTLKINAGDFSHRIPVRARDQLSELATSFNRMTASIEKLIAESKEKERLESELEIAREVQSQLYPKATPRLRSLEVIGFCRPARMVSGDYYDFIQLNAHWTALAIGDIAGKGISAALLMASIQSSLRAQLSSNRWLSDGAASAAASPSTSELTALLNRQLYESTSPEKFATFFLALYHEPTSQLFYTNAGHLPPILLKGSQAHRLEVSGMVLGAFPDQFYDRDSLRLEPGDLLAAYTDGITEPENEYGEEFGEKRLVNLLVRNARLPLREVAEQVTVAVQEWSAAAEQPDDMTLLLIRRL